MSTPCEDDATQPHQSGASTASSVRTSSACTTKNLPYSPTVPVHRIGTWTPTRSCEQSEDNLDDLCLAVQCPEGLPVVVPRFEWDKVHVIENVLAAQYGRLEAVEVALHWV